MKESTVHNTTKPYAKPVLTERGLVQDITKNYKPGDDFEPAYDNVVWGNEFDESPAPNDEKE